MSMMLACYLLIALLSACPGRRPWGLDFSVEALFVAGVFTTGYLRTAPDAPHPPRTHRVATLSAQGLCVVLPCAFFGHSWGADAGFRAGSCLLLFAGTTAWALSPVPAALVRPNCPRTHATWRTAAGRTGATFLAGSAVHGTTRLSLLGISREAMSDIRSLARGYRVRSPATETASARALPAAVDTGGSIRMEMVDDGRFHLVVSALLDNARRPAADRPAGAGPAARPRSCLRRSPEQPVS